MVDVVVEWEGVGAPEEECLRAQALERMGRFIATGTEQDLWRVRDLKVGGMEDSDAAALWKISLQIHVQNFASLDVVQYVLAGSGAVIAVADFKVPDEVEAPTGMNQDLELSKKLDTPLKTFPFSVRTFNGLENERCRYVGELVQKTEVEVLRIHNLGQRCLNEIKEVLEEMGLRLGMDVGDWQAP